MYYAKKMIALRVFFVSCVLQSTVNLAMDQHVSLFSEEFEAFLQVADKWKTSTDELQHKIEIPAAGAKIDQQEIELTPRLISGKIQGRKRDIISSTPYTREDKSVRISYQCTQCKRIFHGRNAKDHCVSHARTHFVDLKPFHCDLCDIWFLRSWGLRGHLQTQHNIKAKKLIPDAQKLEKLKAEARKLVSKVE